MRECRSEGCPHIAADGCDYCMQHDEPARALPDQGTSAALCVECGGSQVVVYRLGAWWCPVHRDLGTVRFVPNDSDPLKRGVPTIVYNSHGYADVEAYDNAVVERDRLRAENEALRRALGFYSDGFAYLTPEGWRAIWRDGGKTARAALASDEQHVCPSSGEPCPCLPGSTSEAYCSAEERHG